MAATVTIDRNYFETLLRRAEFHTTGRDFSTPLDLPVVTIPKVDHDNLLQAAKEYALLKDALYRGGIAQENLTLLIQGGEPAQRPPDAPDDAFSEVSYSASKREYQSNMFSADSPLSALRSSAQASLKPWSGSHHRQGAFRQNSFPNDENSYFVPDGPNVDSYRLSTPTPERPYARQEQRSVCLKNLSDKVTHKDIAGVVRGGALLDIYLRVYDRSASVAFVEGTAAQAFLHHAKRNDIYLYGKRVELMWNDRQFILPPHVATKISNGASRILLIRNGHPDITEQRIRDDLDHIHNLVVVDLTVQKKDILVSLNSVHNALFARTCLMSRGKYKGFRIEFYPDECAQPLPVTPRPVRSSPVKPEQKQQNAMVNRFQMLNTDGTEDGSSNSDESEHVAKFVPKGWAGTPVAA